MERKELNRLRRLYRIRGFVEGYVYAMNEHGALLDDISSAELRKDFTEKLVSIADLKTKHFKGSDGITWG